MVMELLGHKDYIRVLLAVRKEGSLRFRQIEKSLVLNPAQVDRALKFLTKGLWIVPRTVPTEGSHVPVEYRLGKRGASFLELFDGFRAGAKRKSAELGASEVKELQSLCA
jgi:DNA-binding HxlR family transcriptional regulator